MMISETLCVSGFENLELRIFVVGYPVQGESVLMLILDKDRVLFSAITDCYAHESDGYNHVAEILRKYSVKAINAVVWTHPDKDHSVGMEAILDEFDRHRKASILVPMGLNVLQATNAEAKALMSYLGKSYVQNGADKLAYVRYGSCPIRLTFMDETFHKINCTFNIALPNDSVVYLRTSGTTNYYANDLSIVYDVEFNGFRYLFCGDLSGVNVKYLNKDFYQRVNFIKIPHHGSEEPSTFTNKLMSEGVQGAIAVTTIYKKKLPKPDVLDLYKFVAKGIYSTGKGIYPYGCVEVAINAKTMHDTVTMGGNAFCYYS